MKTLAELNLGIAYITHPVEEGVMVYFQVLNEAGDDWDEAATQAAYQEFLNQN